jgi:hypothetical protein
VKLKITVTEPNSKYGYQSKRYQDNGNSTRTHIFTATRPVIVHWEPGFPGTDVTGSSPDEVWIEEEGNEHNRLYLETPGWYHHQRAEIRIEPVEE